MPKKKATAVTSPVDTREAWLLRASHELLGLIASKTDLSEPARVQVSVGFPMHERDGNVIGECYTRDCGSGVTQLFISPRLKDPIKVLYTLLHELLHACDDCQNHHGKVFSQAARKVGLAGKPTATYAEEGSELYEFLQGLSAQLGGYPHMGLEPGFRMKKKQSTRMIKCACDECGYQLRITRKWLEVAVPECPDEDCDRHHQPLTIYITEEEGDTE